MTMQAKEKQIRKKRSSLHHLQAYVTTELMQHQVYPTEKLWSKTFLHGQPDASYSTLIRYADCSPYPRFTAESEVNVLRSERTAPGLTGKMGERQAVYTDRPLQTPIPRSGLPELLEWLSADSTVSP